MIPKFTTWHDYKKSTDNLIAKWYKKKRKEKA